jgi:hypothetical protein
MTGRLRKKSAPNTSNAGTVLLLASQFPATLADDESTSPFHPLSQEETYEPATAATARLPPASGLCIAPRRRQEPTMHVCAMPSILLLTDEDNSGLATDASTTIHLNNTSLLIHYFLTYDI